MKILIIEDDLVWQLKIQMLLVQMEFKEYVVVGNLQDALADFSKKEADIIISDIMLPDGVVFEKMDIFFKNIPTIFITSYADATFLEQAISYKDARFIVKPFNQFTLQAAIISLAKNLSTIVKDEKKTIRVRGKHGHTIHLDLDLILYIQAEGNYITIFCEDKKFVYKSSLRKTIEKVDERFVQVQKGFLVNSKHLKRIDFSRSILYINNTQIPIGRFYKPQVIELASKYLNN